jgi:Dynamin family
MDFNRTTAIDRIISIRRSTAERIDKVSENLAKLRSLLINLRDCRQQLLTLDISESQRSLADVNFDILPKLIEKIDAGTKALNKLEPRFSRNTLNIAVLGNAGTGKSTLLENLAGLPEGIVPRSSQGHCTSVAFSIENGEGDSVIDFHTEQSFLKDIIHPYYRELSLGKQPERLADFERELPSLNSDLSTLKGKYNQLQEYHKHLESYRSLLTGHQLKIPRNEISEIRQYLAHKNLEGNSIYESMAVKKAKIIYKFPDPDVGRIALVDTPGLDDPGIDHFEKLTEILEHDVDIILLVWLPPVQRANFRNDDYRLYEIAQKALGKKLPIKQWSFFILNQLDSVKGDNQENCQYIAEELAKTPIEVVEKPIIVNCLDPQATKTEILDRVLKYLCKEIGTLDRDYAQACQSEIDEIQKDVEVLLDRANILFPSSDSFSNKELRKLFKELWSRLIPELERLLQILKEESKTNQEVAFQSQVRKAFQDSLEDRGIPDQETIELIRIKKGGNYRNTYNICLDRMRTNFSKKFANIDIGLKDLVEDTKSRVAEILVNYGSLGGLTEHRGHEFIKYMAENIPDQYKNIKEGFEILSGFELSYRGLFQPRIRKHLSLITPDETDVQLPANENANGIVARLTKLHGEVLSNCEGAMRGMDGEPKLAAFAIFEEFFDQVVNAEDVEEQWQDFLEDHKQQIWVSRFNPDPQIKALEGKWSKFVKECQIVNQIDSLKFLD